MSIFDEERKQRGLPPVGSPSPSPDTASDSMFAKERERLQTGDVLGTYTFTKKDLGIDEQTEDTSRLTPLYLAQKSREEAGKYFDSNGLTRGIRDYILEPYADAVDNLPKLFGLPVNETRQFTDRIGQSAGAVQGLTPQYVATTGNKVADAAADVIGSGAGLFVNPASLENGIVQGAYMGLERIGLTRAGRKIADTLADWGEAAASKINPVLNKQGIHLSGELAGNATRGLTRGAAAGAMYGATQPFVYGDPSSDNLIDSITANTLLFGGGDAALPVAGALFKNSKLGQLFDDFLKRSETPQDKSQGEILALPSPRVETRLKSAFERSQNGDSNVSTMAPGDYAPNSLPAPTLEPPTIARIERKAPNPYAQRLDELFSTAREQGLPPGLEREALDDLWSRMAGPEDPNLDRLIELATPSLQQLERRTPTLGKLQRAKELQQQREVYGVGMPVKSLADRYKGGVVSSAASPLERVGLARTAGALDDILPAGRGTDEVAASAERTGLARTYFGKDEVLHSDPAPVPKLQKRTAQEIQRDNNVELFKAHNQDTKIPDTTSQLASKLDREPLNIPDRLNEVYIKTNDNLQRINQFDKSAASASGGKLEPQDKAYMLALNSRGSDIISKQILTNNMVDSQGNVIGGSLKDITSQIPKGKEKEFSDYLINRHAVSRMKSGEKVFSDDLKMSPEKSEQIVKNYEAQYPEFKKLAEANDEFNRQLGKSWLVDTGIISPEQWQAYLDENPHYVPNNRLFGKMEKMPLFSRLQKGFVNQTNPVKEATGSQRKIIDPIESQIEHVAQYVKTAKRNEVGQALLRQLRTNPEELKGWAEIVPSKDSLVFDVNKVLHEEGIDGIIERFNKPFDEVFNKQQPKPDNVVTVLENGQPVHIQINDLQLFEAMTNLAPKAQHFLIDAVGQVTRVMKLLTTGVNPIFSLTRNLFRDIPEAYKNSKTTNNPAVFAKDLLGAIVNVVKNDEIYNSYKNIGGGHSSSVAADRNLLAQSKRSILPQSGIRTGLARGIDFLENLNNAAETAPRLAEYKRIAKEGEYGSKVQGLYEANDITTNFSRYGDVGKSLDAIFPYMNAAIQGLDKTFRSYKDNPLQATLKSFAAITVPTVVLYAINYDDPDYELASTRDKDMFFLIPKGDGTFVKIPKTRESGTVFGTAVERTLRQWNDEDPEAFRGFAKAIRDNFLPPGIKAIADGRNPLMDTILGPLVSITANKDFADRPIVPGGLQKASPENQWDNRTSEIGKGLARIMPGEQSPKQIDYLIKSYSGVIGQVGLPLTTDGNSFGDAMKHQVTNDPVFSNDIMQRFYETKEKLEMAQTDYKLTRLQTKEYNNELRAYFNRVDNQLSNLRTQAKQIQEDGQLSNQEKKERLRALQVEMNHIAQNANQRAEAR
jgi:hypothetical protein